MPTFSNKGEKRFEEKVGSRKNPSSIGNILVQAFSGTVIFTIFQLY